MMPTERLLAVQRLRGECETHTRTAVSVRDLHVIVDEPAERAGTNRGPAPTESMMAGLIGATNVIGHRCAARHGVEIARMSVEVEATFDRRGVVLQEEVDVPFTHVRVVIHVATDAGAEPLALVQADLERFCPLTKVLRRAGTEVEKVWRIERP